MKSLKILAILLILSLMLPVQAQEEGSTTIYLIRHAEKDRSDKSNRNPHLTEKGNARALKWAEVLKNVSFDAVYSTDYHRTKETATPTLKQSNLKGLQMYDPRDLDIDTFLKENKGKTVLVVGHSNTTPYVTNDLLGKQLYKEIADTNNGNLYIVTISASGERSSQLLYIN